MARKPIPQRSLSVSPSSISVGNAYTVSGGSDHRDAVGADGLLHVNLANPGCCLAFAVKANADGSFAWTSPDNMKAAFPGTYYFRVVGVRPKTGSLYHFSEISFPVGP